MRRGMQSCPLCGQSFGSASIAIHIPQCHTKLLKRWDALPRHERGPKPVLPGSMVQAPPSTTAGMGSAFSEVSKRTSASGGRGPAIGGRGTSSGSTFDSTPIRPGGGGVSKGQMLDQGAQHYASQMPRCRFCNRSFAPDRVVKHESCCIESKGGARRKFNAKKQRLDCFDAYELGSAAPGRFGGRAGKTSRPAAVVRGPPKTSWRQQHHQFQQAMRAAKMTAPSQNYGGGGYSGMGRGPGSSHQARGSGMDVARRNVSVSSRGLPPPGNPKTSGGGAQRFGPGMARYGAQDDAQFNSGVRQTGGAKGRVPTQFGSTGAQRYGSGGGMYDPPQRQPPKQPLPSVAGTGGGRFSSSPGSRTLAGPGAGGISNSNETSSAMKEAFGMGRR